MKMWMGKDCYYYQYNSSLYKPRMTCNYTAVKDPTTGVWSKKYERVEYPNGDVYLWKAENKTFKLIKQGKRTLLNLIKDFFKGE